MKKIGVLTGGGDAPGLNAVIRAVVKAAELSHGLRVLGISDGFDGVLMAGGIRPPTSADVRGILPRGGTIFGTANRGNPSARVVARPDRSEEVMDVSGQVIEALKRLALDALIVVGGEGTLHVALDSFYMGIPIIGVPKTIDNGVGGTEITFGFDTAVVTATEALGKLHATAEAHHRAMVLELMGRAAGFIALQAGVAGGADVILIPEMRFDCESVNGKVLERASRGSKFSLIAAAERAHPRGEEPPTARPGDRIYSPRLGGIREQVARQVDEACHVETRVTVPGHLQRGGSPSPFDRWLATRFGAAAVRLAMRAAFGQMVSVREGAITEIALAEALAKLKRVDPAGEAVGTARDLGISLGS